MLVEDRRTGKKVRIESTEELRQKTRNIFKECEHSRVELREVPQRGGSTRIQEICFKCGKSIGQPVKRTSLKDLPPKLEFDLDKLRTTYEQERQKEYEDLLQAAVEQQVEINSKTSRRYRDYLQSDAWRAKRKKVLKRANHTCEGCLEAKAVEVHHLTYENFGDELLFQLVALCKTCHEKCYSVLDDLNCSSEDPC